MIESYSGDLSAIEKIIRAEDSFQRWLAAQLRAVDERRAFMLVLAARGLRL